MFMYTPCVKIRQFCILVNFGTRVLFSVAMNIIMNFFLICINLHTTHVCFVMPVIVSNKGYHTVCLHVKLNAGTIILF